MIQSKKLSARIESYREAIAAARAAGVTWEQIASALGGKPKYVAALYHKRPRYPAAEQLPLPEPEQTKKIVQSAQSQTQGQQRPLPTVPGTIPDDPDDRIAALAKKGIVFK
ncbi:MAG: hypothetical protein U7M05_11720 [Candidatus Igneacidithiobacillus chanchocoensis]